jgi:hypothetical protein
MGGGRHNSTASRCRWAAELSSARRREPRLDREHRTPPGPPWHAVRTTSATAISQPLEGTRRNPQRARSGRPNGRRSNRQNIVYKSDREKKRVSGVFRDASAGRNTIGGSVRMKIHRTVASGALTAAALCGVTVSVSASASASAMRASAATCDVQIGQTYKSGNDIVGYGSLSNCSSWSTGRLYIQRQIFPGNWGQVGTIATAHQGYDTYVRYNCSGTGTQSWRTLISFATVGGPTRIKVSNVIRVYCG